MSLLFMDGCGEYYNTSQLGRVWNSFQNVTVESSLGRRSGACIEIESTTENVGVGFAAAATIGAGWAGRLGSLVSGTSNPYFQFFGEGVLHLTMTIDNAGTIYIKNGSQTGTIIGTSAAGVVSAGQFHYFEVLATIHNTTGSVKVVVDGQTVINETNVDTAGAGSVNDIIDSAYWRSPANVDGHRIDDVYIIDTAGSAPWNDLLGDVRIDALLPDGTGATSQFDTTNGSATHYQNVDENPATDDTDYNETPTANDVDLFTFGNLPTVVGGASVLGVQANITAKKTDAGSCTIRAVARPSATNRNGATKFLQTDYVVHQEIWQASPETSSAWTESEVDGSQFGVEKL